MVSNEKRWKESLEGYLEYLYARAGITKMKGVRVAINGTKNVRCICGTVVKLHGAMKNVEEEIRRVEGILDGTV